MAKDTRSELSGVAGRNFSEKNLTRRWELGRLLKLQDVQHTALFISIFKKEKDIYMQ